MTGKVATTPADQSEGVVAGSAGLGMDGARFLHGTTVATNALLERRGADCALLTSSGFEDVLEIGRQDRPSLYDGFADRASPLVPGARRHGVPRADELPSVAELETMLADSEAVAISLLDAYRDAVAETELERRVRIARPDAYVSRSSAVAPEFREFERTSTTVLSAYLGPVTERYLSSLVSRLGAAGLSSDVAVMRSSGGLMSVAEASELAAAILLSGPAGGVVAAAALGDALGRDRLVSFDMGGTSTDVCRIDDGRPEIAYERAVGGLPCRLPSVAVHTVGAGGGSIGWIDPGRSLRVGPQSAGAQPGPASYGRGGTEAAVTDANVALGRIAPDALLAGSLPIEAARAEAALERLGEPLGLSVPETALGMLAIVEEVMAGAIRKVSIEQGADPRTAALVAFGGAGGLHAVALARRLSMAGVVVPPHAGVFSALGLLLSPLRVDTASGAVLRQGEEHRLRGALAATADDARRRLAAAGAASGVRVETAADVRYLGQSHELTVACAAGVSWEALAADFHSLHMRRNGFSRPDDPIEVVAVRAHALATPHLRWSDIPVAPPSGPARRPDRDVITNEGTVRCGRWWRPGLAPGAEVTGPAIVEETEATTFLPAGSRAVVHDSGALEVEW